MGLVRLAGSQPASSVFLSHQFSISHQPPASQQYFSLTRNQHQSLATSQPNEAMAPACAGPDSCVPLTPAYILSGILLSIHLKFSLSIWSTELQVATTHS
jgi:hypothetical protein